MWLQDYSLFAGIIVIVVFVMRILHFVVDYVTKTEIENRVFYQGKAKANFFILIAGIVYVSFFLKDWAAILEKEKDISIVLSLVAPVFSAFPSTIILISFIIVVYSMSKLILFVLYDIEYYLYYKSENWLILKVTKDGQIILKKDDNYAILKSYEELCDKKITHKVVKRFSEWRKKRKRSKS